MTICTPRYTSSGCTTMTKEILLEDVPGPCPKCGGINYTMASETRWPQVVWVKCLRYGCLYEGPKAGNRVLAVKMWNARDDRETR